MLKTIVFILLALVVTIFLVSYIHVIGNFKYIKVPTQNYIQSNFTREEVLLFSEQGFSKKTTGPECLLKFAKPSITFKVLGQPSPDQLQFLFKNVDTINQMLENHRLCYVPNAKAPTDLTYYFWTDLECKQLPKYYTQTRDALILPVLFPNTELKNEVIIISTFPRSTEKIKSSIFNETIKALGFFNRTAYSRDRSSIDTIFSAKDRACIKMMYNSGLSSGTYQSHFKATFNITEDEIWEVLYKPKRKAPHLFD